MHKYICATILIWPISIELFAVAKSKIWKKQEPNEAETGAVFSDFCCYCSLVFRLKFCVVHANMYACVITASNDFGKCDFVVVVVHSFVQQFVHSFFIVGALCVLLVHADVKLLFNETLTPARNIRITHIFFHRLLFLVFCLFLYGFCFSG